MTRYYLTRIQADGVHKFKGAELKLSPKSEMYLVLGRNLDVNGATSNGAGKTGIFNILSWVLMGKIPGKGSEVLEVGNKKGWGIVELTSETGDVLLVERKKSGSNTELSITVNGEPITTSGEGIRKPQLQLNTFLGLPDDSTQSFYAFLNTIYLTFDFVRGFADTDTTASDRIDLLTKYLGLDVLGDVADQLKKERNSLDEELVGNRSIIEDLSKRVEEKPDIERFIVSSELEIKNLSESIINITGNLSALPDTEGILQKEIKLKDALEAVRIRERNELQPLRDKRTRIQGSLEALGSVKLLEEKLASLVDRKDTFIDKDAIQLDSLQRELEVVRGRIANAESSRLRLLSDQHAALNNKFTRCPACNEALLVKGLSLEKFSVSTHETHVKELSDSLKATENVLNNDKVLKDEYLAAIQDLQKKKAESESLEKLIRDLRDRIAAHYVSSEKLNDDLGELNRQGKTLSLALTALTDELTEQLVNVRQGLDLERIATERNSLRSSLDEYKHRLDGAKIALAKHNERLRMVVVDEDRKRKLEDSIRGTIDRIEVLDNALKYIPAFRVHELERSLPELERLTNYHLAGLQYEYRVKFPIGMNKSRTEFPIIVTDELGIDRPFGTFSHGERQRISLACAFAQRNLAQDSGGFLLACLLLDEVFDGLDEGGRDNLIRHLSTCNDQCFIITHGIVNDLIPKSIVVTRNEGVSTFKGSF